VRVDGGLYGNYFRWSFNYKEKQMQTVGIVCLILFVLLIIRVQYMKIGKLRLAFSSSNGGKPQVTYMDHVAFGKYLKGRSQELVELRTPTDGTARITLRFHFGDNSGHSQIEISGKPEQIAIVKDDIAKVWGLKVSNPQER
jgi:hypothetical protein